MGTVKNEFPIIAQPHLGAVSFTKSEFVLLSDCSLDLIYIFITRALDS
jgi:hypothetical protein